MPMSGIPTPEEFAQEAGIPMAGAPQGQPGPPMQQPGAGGIPPWQPSPKAKMVVLGLLAAGVGAVVGIAIKSALDKRKKDK